MPKCLVIEPWSHAFKIWNLRFQKQSGGLGKKMETLASVASLGLIFVAARTTVFGVAAKEFVWRRLRTVGAGGNR